ncbi:polyphosphate polymerase domain-containing protein [Proteocatella sphenisci]|uniref:polyphosphate polymerase domain-containing protein n=1 Tax=Proteocatella sphenisci TaxID=181070 RepID=UPI0004BAD2E1|nr:polyphosphate polymerase domain-containing protein [Proteocatella sphenisci]
MSDEKTLLDVSRTEKKYGISKITASNMRRIFSTTLKSDKHNTGDGYMVRSLYFDSYDDSDYYDKEDGYNYRKKIRLRIYSTDSEVAKLEKKEKVGSNQWKRSLSISKSDALKLIDGDFSPLIEDGSDFAFEMYEIMTIGIYRPRCIIEYDRVAFIVEENDIRLTLDSNIRATESNFDLFSENLQFYPVSHPTEVTLEVKYDNFLFSYIKEMLALCDKKQISNSKYIMGRSVSRFNSDGFI